jgi:hypothetical protein
MGDAFWRLGKSGLNRARTAAVHPVLQDGGATKGDGRVNCRCPDFVAQGGSQASFPSFSDAELTEAADRETLARREGDFDQFQEGFQESRRPVLWAPASTGDTPGKIGFCDGQGKSSLQLFHEPVLPVVRGE